MPKLKVAQKEVDEKIVFVDAEKAKVAGITKEVEKESAAAKEKADAAELIKNDCAFELSKCMPILNAALRAVG